MAALFGVIGYWIRPDIIGVVLGIILISLPLFALALVLQYALHQRRGGSGPA